MATFYRKKIMCLLIIAFCVLLQGCAKPEEGDAEILSHDVTYEGKEVVLQGMEGDVVQYRMKGETLYVLTCAQEKSHLYRAALEGGRAEEIPFSGDGCIRCFYVGGEGSIYCLVSAAADGGLTGLVKLDADGKEKAGADLRQALSLDGEGLLNCMAVDSRNNVILSDGDTVYSLDAELRPVDKFRVREKCKLIHFVAAGSGGIACAVNQELNGWDYGRICILDTEKGEWGDFLKLVDDAEVDEHCLMEGKEYAFYYKYGGGVYGYGSGDVTWTTVLDARCSLLTRDDVAGMSNEENGTVLGALSGSANDGDGFALELYAPVRSGDGKKVITLAGYNVINRMRAAAREFNRTHTDCRVEIQIYEDEERTKLAMDIAAGKVPDIIPVSHTGISMDEWIRKGVLEDLTPYYEKDGTVSMEDVVPSVLQGMKQDGGLYCVAPYFTVWSAACRADDAREGKGWDVGEMRAMLDERGEGALPFDTVDKEEMLCYFLIANLNEFIDWDTGECHFDSREFTDMLELCNEGILADSMSEEEYLEQCAEVERKMQEGKVLLSVSQSVTLEDIQMARQQFGSTDIAYIGYPEKDRQGSYFIFPEQYGIFSGSGVKEEAWEFIRMLMGEDYQADPALLSFAYLPTRKDCLDWKLQALSATEAYEDRYGNHIEPVETCEWQSGLSGLELKTGPASAKDVEVMLDLIGRTKKRASEDEEGMEIVQEDARMYFYGDKSLEETVKVIQKRMKTYVNEHRK